MCLWKPTLKPGCTMRNLEGWLRKTQSDSWGTLSRVKGKSRSCFLFWERFWVFTTTQSCVKVDMMQVKRQKPVWEIWSQPLRRLQRQKGSCTQEVAGGVSASITPKLHFWDLVLQERAWDGLSAKAVKEGGRNKSEGSVGPAPAKFHAKPDLRKCYWPGMRKRKIHW